MELKLWRLQGPETHLWCIFSRIATGHISKEAHRRTAAEGRPGDDTRSLLQETDKYQGMPAIHCDYQDEDISSKIRHKRKYVKSESGKTQTCSQQVGLGGKETENHRKSLPESGVLTLEAVVVQGDRRFLGAPASCSST